MCNLDIGILNSPVKPRPQRSDGIDLPVPFSGKKVDGTVVIQSAVNVIAVLYLLQPEPWKVGAGNKIIDQPPFGDIFLIKLQGLSPVREIVTRQSPSVNYGSCPHR